MEADIYRDIYIYICIHTHTPPSDAFFIHRLWVNVPQYVNKVRAQSAHGLCLRGRPPMGSDVPRPAPWPRSHWGGVVGSSLMPRLPAALLHAAPFLRPRELRLLANHSRLQCICGSCASRSEGQERVGLVQRCYSCLARFGACAEPAGSRGVLVAARCCSPRRGISPKFGFKSFKV